MLKSVLSIFRRRNGALSAGDVELMGLLRARPGSALSGSDLVTGKKLASQGYLRATDGLGHFVLTEKGLTAYLGKH